MKAILTPIACFFLHLLFAQPGGGGGLLIKNIYTTDGQNINLLTDPNIHIRSFFLNNGIIDHETYRFQQLQKNQKAFNSSRPVSFSLAPQKGEDVLKTNSRFSSQRLLITYKNQTMLLDFTGVYNENAGGYTQTMDSLVIQNGYFIVENNWHTKRKLDPVSESEAPKWLSNGITPTSTRKLIEKNIIQFSSNFRLDFLQAQFLPATYFIEAAQYELQQKNLSVAYSHIQTAIQKNKGVTNCACLFLLVDYYTKSQQYANAITTISNGLDCKRNDWEQDYRENNLLTRANLFEKNNQFSEAAKDYNALVNLSDNKIEAELNRSQFLMRQQNPVAVIQNLQLLLAENPAKEAVDLQGYRSDYNQVYFQLAEAEYKAQLYDSAFYHWLKAEETGYHNNSDWQIISYYTNLIQQHPAQPNLYVARALAHYQRGPYLGWGDSTKSAFQLALADTYEAEKRGRTDFKIYLYRAQILHQLKQNKEAFTVINQAIQLNPLSIQCYATRYQIRTDLGQTQWGDKTDPDQVIIENLRKKQPTAITFEDD